MTPPPRARANTVGVHRWRTTLNKQRKLRKQLGSLLAGHSGQGGGREIPRAWKMAEGSPGNWHRGQGEDDRRREKNESREWTCRHERAEGRMEWFSLCHLLLGDFG